MNIILDGHIHSRFSRACSKDLNLDTLEQYARLKGITLLGTGDFLHPQWNKELKENLTQGDDGILRSKTDFPFVLQTEIANVFTQGGKGRRVHNLLFAPNLEVVDQLIEAFLKRGRVDYDGRPIFGMSCIELVDMVREISPDIEIIPAHAWTPWFGILGSKSGFDSLQDCFQERMKYIHAIETGLSSDPPMNWRVSSLDGIQLVSFSDSHSYWPWRMGREVTVLDTDLAYKKILHAFRTGEGLKETIEVDPNYGKYHFDGHRACGIVYNPEQSKKVNGMCPQCRRPLTLGVMGRIEELADKPEDYKPTNAKPFKRLIPLSEIIAALYKSQPFSKKVQAMYYDIHKQFGNEFSILIDAQKEELEKAADPAIAQAILKVREDRLEITPGFDGVYGVPVFNEQDRPQVTATASVEKKPQKSLSDFT